MWLPILICLAAVALLLGPIMLMQPSAAQRREAGLRQRAIENGLRVHLQVPPEGTQSPLKNKALPMYCLPWTEQADTRHTWGLVKKPYAHELHWAGKWDWAIRSENRNVERVMVVLESAPEKVLALVSGPQGLCAFWSELGSPDDVDEISNWLKLAVKTLKQEG